MSDDHDDRHRGRWIKGKSGNPKGRPKKAKPSPSSNMGDYLAAALEAPVQVNQGGRIKTMTRCEAIVETLVADALKASGPDKVKCIDAIIRMRKHFPGKPAAQPERDFSWGDEQEALYQELERKCSPDWVEANDLDQPSEPDDAD